MGPVTLFGGMIWLMYWFAFTPTSVDGRLVLSVCTVFLALVALKCDLWIGERNSRDKTR